MDIPKVDIKLWLDDAIVLRDWLQQADLNQIPADHPAVKQALTDLFSRLEEVVPYVSDMSDQRIQEARDAVAKDMGW